VTAASYTTPRDTISEASARRAVLPKYRRRIAEIKQELSLLRVPFRVKKPRESVVNSYIQGPDRLAASVSAHLATARMARETLFVTLLTQSRLFSLPQASSREIRVAGRLAALTGASALLGERLVAGERYSALPTTGDALFSYRRRAAYAFAKNIAFK
jgi:hypothetical protein